MAVIVAMSPMPSFTVSFESLLRCCDGRTAVRSKPISAPPATHANTVKAIMTAFMIVYCLRLGPGAKRGAGQIVGPKR